MGLIVTNAEIFSLRHAAEGILEVFSSWLEKMTKGGLDLSDPWILSHIWCLILCGALKQHSYRLCSSGTQRSKCTCSAEPNAQSLPGNQGLHPGTAPQPALGNITGSAKRFHWLQPRCSAMSCQVPSVYGHEEKAPLFPKKLREISFDKVFWKITCNILLVLSTAREKRDLQKI